MGASKEGGRIGTPGADVLIKMSPSSLKEGKCFHSSLSLTPLTAEHDLFVKAGLGGPQLMELAANASKANSPNTCDENDTFRAKATSECNHIQDPQVREACIFDGCSSGNINMAVEAANDAVLM